MKQVPATAFSKYLEKPLNDNMIVIYGDEQFFFDSILDQIEGTVFTNKSDKDLNYHLFYGTESSVSDILSACLSFPMLSDKKMVVVKEFDQLQVPDKESFLKYIANPQLSTLLVLTADRFGGNKFQNDILNKSLSINCKNLSNGNIYQWSLQKFKEYEITADKESIVFLIENIGSNLLRLNLEIEKIKNFIGQGQKLTVREVAQITGFTREVNIFNFQKVLGAKNLKSSLTIGYHLLEQGESLAAILPMIFIFFRRMWAVKQLTLKNHTQKQIVDMLGGNPYAYKDIFAACVNFSFRHLQFLFGKILEAERQLKTTQKSAESILTILSYHICNFKKN